MAHLVFLNQTKDLEYPFPTKYTPWARDLAVALLFLKVLILGYFNVAFTCQRCLRVTLNDWLPPIYTF